MISSVIPAHLYFQIFNPIVLPILVFVVNDLIISKPSANMPFHNQSMLTNIFVFTAPLLWWQPNKRIAPSALFYPAMPVSIKFTGGNTAQRTKFHSFATTPIQMWDCFSAIEAWWTRNESRHINNISKLSLITEVFYVSKNF